MALEQTIERKQQKAIKNKALEYRAWFLRGDVEQLESRMSEQSLQAGDVLFVRIFGEGMNYVKFTPHEMRDLPYEELAKLDPMEEGSKVMMSDDRWIVSSVSLGEGGMRLQAGKNSKALRETLADFQRGALFLMIPGVIFSVLSGMFLAYRFLTPTRRLATTMREVLSSGDLSRRATVGQNRNELNEMVDLFNELLEKNENLIKLMQESLDNIAHDLKSPLSRISMVSERALTIQDESECLLALEDTAEEANYMGQLLTLLMDVAEAESGAMVLRKERVFAFELLNGVAELYEFSAEEKEIEIRVECSDELSFIGDRVRLIQCLANLVDNALKYSFSESIIYLKAYELDGFVCVFVADEGQGIRDEDLPFIWDRLYRADRSRTEKGMGLGLSLVRAITESHGGEVSVDSQEGEGTLVGMRLPLE